jgi:uncharacterized protein YaaN involved in tellurite resistance
MELTIITQEIAALAEHDKSGADEDIAQEVNQLKQQLDMLDRRLDNIDSMVTAVAERVMRQPITFNATCSKCGHKIEIAIIGTEKPTR